MAVPYVVREIDPWIRIVEWHGLVRGDTGEPYSIPAVRNQSVQVSGYFGAEGVLVIEGCNKIFAGETWATLHGGQMPGQELVFVGPGLDNVTDHAYWVRPKVPSASDDTNIDVDLFLVLVRSGT